MTDFDKLSDIAYNRETLKPADREDLSNLWEAFFKLENWIFMVDASQTTESPKPFIGFIDERPWLFVFTDSQKAYDFAKQYELLDKKGECLFLSLNPESARKMLKSGEGQVDGIRINEGVHGWFAPNSNIDLIYDHLKESGKL